MNPKKKALSGKPVPVRIDAATRTNLDAIKASGLASTDSAAIRAAVAIVARLAEANSLTQIMKDAIAKGDD